MKVGGIKWGNRTEGGGGIKDVTRDLKQNIKSQYSQDTIIRMQVTLPRLVMFNLSNTVVNICTTSFNI
jgi:hypothetical protein